VDVPHRKENRGYSLMVSGIVRVLSHRIDPMAFPWTTCQTKEGLTARSVPGTIQGK